MKRPVDFEKLVNRIVETQLRGVLTSFLTSLKNDRFGPDDEGVKVRVVLFTTDDGMPERADFSHISTIRLDLEDFFIPAKVTVKRGDIELGVFEVTEDGTSVEQILAHLGITLAESEIVSKGDHELDLDDTFETTEDTDGDCTLVIGPKPAEPTAVTE